MLTKIMGTLLFFTGLAGIVIATLGVLDYLPQLDVFGRLGLYVGGTILCVLGYIMARSQPIVE